jgi:hypothetical protein
MGALSIWHILIYVIIELIWIVPLARLFNRVGYSAWWAVLAVIPPLALVLMWTLAFVPWRIADASDGPFVGERS